MHDGYCYFTIDDGKFYIDYLDINDNNTLKRRPIAGVSVEYIEGTQEVSTNAWTGVTRDNALYKGKIIAYKLPKAGTGTAATLNLTLSNGSTSGAKAVKRQGASSTTTHYPAGTVIFMAYDGTYWQVNADYDTNNAVTQSVTTASEWRKVLLHYTTNAEGGNVPAEVTNKVYAAKGIEVQPSTGTLAATKFKGPLEGNADTTTEFSSVANVTLTGDVSGSASSTKGWDVTTTLVTTGVTAGSYGPSANATPNYGATFNVPYITVDAKGRITAASTKTVKIPASDNTNTATAADNILDGSNSGTQITYAPYTTQQSKLSFDTSTTEPTRTDRLNLNGYLYATKLYSGGAEVLTSHQSLANYKTKQTAISDNTGTSESTTATRFIYSISQNENGEISVKTRPLPTYNNYSLPLAASGTRGGIQIGYSESGNNYAVKLSSEKAYVTVPWTDTKVTAVDNHYAPAADTNAALSASASGASAAWSIDVVKAVQLQRDAKGHVTGVTVTSGKIPANPNTDYRVRQTNDASTNANYRLLLSNSANDTQEDQISRKNANLIYNPSINKLSTGNLDLTGVLNVTGNANFYNQTNADSLTAGSLLVNGNTNFVQSPTAPTPASGDASTKLATTEFVKTSVAGLSGAMHFKGTTTSAIVDGSTTNPIVIDGSNYTAVAGDVVLREITAGNIFEYVWTGSTWEMLGRDTNFKVAQTAIDTGSAATNKWVSRIQQNTNGEITATMGTLDTSGTWSGNAATATVASKLSNTSKIGDTNKPVYFKADGTPTAINYTIDKSVPSNAVFTDRYVNSATFADDSANTATSPVKMTLTRAGSDTATVTANIPKVSSSSAGVAPKGAAVGSQSQSTKFLREDGTWAAPSYTTNTDTTYTFANGTNGSFSVTPSGGSAQTVSIGKPATAGTADVANSVAWGNISGKPDTTLATDTGTSTITLAYGGKYKLTAAGSSVIFTMPSADDTNTWRKIQVNGTDILGTATNTNPLNLKAGSNVTLTNSNGTVTIASTDTDTKVTSVGNHYTPSADTNAELTGALSGTAGTYAKDTEYTVLTGVKAQRDAKGHIVGITYTAQKIKDTNNTYTVGSKVLKVASNTGTATQVIGVNENSSDRTLTISGDGTYLSGEVSGSSNAAVVTITPTDSGATAGSYGDSANQTPSYGATFKVPYITVDEKGRVTEISEHTVKIPASDNTDTKNTAGSTDTSSKIFLIGATSQAENPQTYSDNQVYTTSGVLTAKTFNSTSLTASQAVSTDASKNLVSTNLTVSDPTASGTGITYIATISQSAVGKITVTKSTVRSASTSQTGVVQLSSATNSTSETLAATAKAVKTAYDLADDHKYWANVESTSAATYNKAPEVANIKINGDTSASAASTKNVELVYDATLEVLNFVFS